MQLTRLHVRNYCQFVGEHTMVFRPGLNAIVGPNGYGKTNSLKACYTGVTGDWHRNDGPKDSNINQRMAKGDTSWVELEFSHGAVGYRTHWGLSPETVVMYANGVVYARGATEVKAELVNALRVTPKLIADHVFVDQGDVAAFLSSTDSDRAKLCSRLFGLETADRIYSGVNKHLQGRVVQTTGVLRDRLTAKINELARDRGEATKEYDTYAALLPVTTYVYDEDPLHGVIRDNIRRQTLMTEVNSLRLEVQRLREKLERNRPKYVALADDQRDMNAYLAKHAVERDQARKDVIKWGSINRYAAAKKNLEAQLAALMEESKQNPPPVMPENYVERRGAWMHDWRLLSDQVKQAERFIKAAAEGKTCPGCGTTADVLASAVAIHQDFVDRNKSTLLELDKQCVDSSAFDEARERWATWQHNWDTRELQVRGQLKQMGQLDPPAKTVDELNAFLNDMLIMEQARDDTNKQLNELRYHSDTDRLAAQERQLQTNEASLQAYAHADDAIAEEAKKQLKIRLDALTKRMLAKQRMQQLGHEAMEAQRELAEAIRIENEGKATRAWMTHSEEIKSIAHTSGAPRLSAESNLRALQEDINDLLLRFDAPYRVSVNNTLTFTAHFFRGEKEGIRQPASRLSGGEEVLLALAFRIAVHGRFAGEFGLLCMDEPTASLDQKNLACVMTGFERLRELCHNTGLQVVIITHDERLLPMFDHVIDLGASK